MTNTDLIDIIVGMNNEQQKEFYTGLKAQGFTTEEIQSIQGVVFAHKLYNDTYLYNTLCKSMGEAIYKEMRGEH